MSDDRRQDEIPQSDEEDGEDQPASTPFDSPYFLPVIFWAWTAWFAYDILTNAQAYQDNPKFNEYGLVVTGVLALYFTWSAIKKKRADREGSVD